MFTSTISILCFCFPGAGHCRTESGKSLKPICAFKQSGLPDFFQIQEWSTGTVPSAGEWLVTDLYRSGQQEVTGTVPTQMNKCSSLCFEIIKFSVLKAATVAGIEVNLVATVVAI